MTSLMKNKNTTKIDFYPAALTIGGSDSCGGGGIQADLRTFNAFAVYGCSAVAAVTAQNIFKIADIQAISAESVSAQIDAILDSVPVKFAKCGMLVNPEIVRAVAAAVRKYKLKLVVDPVFADDSGKELLSDDGWKVLCDELLGTSYLVAPNVVEAERLVGMKIKNEKDLFNAAKSISDTYKTICVIKGGQLKQDKYAVDAVAYDGHIYQLRAPMLKNCRHTHGIGCTFSAAICANLALGMEWDDALLESKTFVFGSIAEPVRLGENTEVMYPPETDFSEHISLLEI